MSELDEYAVEQALQLNEKNEGTEVTVLTVGPERAVDAIRKGLQMGADKGVHVQDEAIAGSDARGTSLVLAEAIKKLEYDVVMCGMASTDGSMGVVPAMLAERLGLPQVTLGSVVEMQGREVRIKRDGDTATEIIGATAPFVLSVTDQSGEARYPVLVDHVDGVVRKTTNELLTIARRLRESSAVFVGSPSAAAAALKGFGAEKVYVVDDAEVKGYLVAAKAEALAQLVETQPGAVLISSSAEGKEVAARLAVKTESGLITDVVDVQGEVTPR